MAWCSNPNINGVTWPQTLLLVCSYTPRGALPNFMAAYPQYRTSNRKHFIEPYTKGSSCSLCVFDPNDPNQDIEEMRYEETALIIINEAYVDMSTFLEGR